jgi:hypothetical protein
MKVRRKLASFDDLKHMLILDLQKPKLGIVRIAFLTNLSLNVQHEKLKATLIQLRGGYPEIGLQAISCLLNAAQSNQILIPYLIS